MLTGLPDIDGAWRDEAAIPVPKVVADPSGRQRSRQNISYMPVNSEDPDNAWSPSDLRTINRAYDVDTFIRQAVKKHLQVIVKHGWTFKGKDQRVKDYLTLRFNMMSHQTGVPFNKLIINTVNDLVKYNRAAWVIRRGPAVDTNGHPLPGMPRSGVRSQHPILGYFRLDPLSLRMQRDPETQQDRYWIYRTPNGKEVRWALSNVVVFEHGLQAGEDFPSPDFAAAVEDVSSYRDCEEMTMKLLNRHLSPTIQHEIPDRTGLGFGLQEDVDLAYTAEIQKGHGGVIVTPPGHKITVIGAESRALRAEGYLKMLQGRVWVGLGVNDGVMGNLVNMTAAHADAMTTTLHNAAKLIQMEFAETLTLSVLGELMMEGGFNPLNPAQQARWMWNEIELEARLKLENHLLQMWLDSAITLDELRRETGRDDIEDVGGEGRLFFRLVKIPTIQAGQQEQDGQGDAAANKNNPANQHGKRGAPKIAPK